MGPEARVNVKVSIYRFDQFVFRETLSKSEKATREEQIVVPYTFPETTNPVYSVIWSTST